MTSYNGYESPKPVPQSERPEKTLENVPKEKVIRLIRHCLYYDECPFCGERDWFLYWPNKNSYVECEGCEEELIVTG